ncbi:MAG: EAL domain-containing protein, partial [Anaerolineae bacterium]|nr:EAL domain-containing protein [Anaerolineae bacterium]
RVVAEGVERYRELELLQDLGVRYIQGFLFGRPRSVATANLEPLNQVSKHPGQGVISAA